MLHCPLSPWLWPSLSWLTRSRARMPLNEACSLRAARSRRRRSSTSSACCAVLMALRPLMPICRQHACSQPRHNLQHCGALGNPYLEGAAVSPVCPSKHAAVSYARGLNSSGMRQRKKQPKLREVRKQPRPYRLRGCNAILAAGAMFSGVGRVGDGPGVALPSLGAGSASTSK